MAVLVVRTLHVWLDLLCSTHLESNLGLSGFRLQLTFVNHYVYYRTTARTSRQVGTWTRAGPR